MMFTLNLIESPLPEIESEPSDRAHAQVGIFSMLLSNDAVMAVEISK